MKDTRFAEGQLYSIFTQGFIQDVTLQGEFAYINLGGPVRAKVELKETGVEIKILSCTAGYIDHTYLGFEYILGQRPSNVTKDRMITPRIHEQTDGWGKLITSSWYEFQPTDDDYRDIYNAITKYTNAFRLE